MAVGAEQDAFRGFLPRPLDGSCDALATKVEALGRGIDVVELQAPDAVPITACRAFAACLVDEDLLHLAPPVADSRDHAAGAAVVGLRPDLAKPGPPVSR